MRRSTWANVFLLLPASLAGQNPASTYPQIHGAALQPAASPPAVKSIAAGYSYSLAVTSDGSVWEWGGSAGRSSMPVRVSGLTGVIAAARGDEHTLALRDDGTVWAWGSNSSGELGDGTTTSRSVPVQVGGLTDVAAVAAGSGYSLALKRDGTVWSWGWTNGPMYA